jgi:deoxyribodipyrimidine photolyase
MIFANFLCQRGLPWLEGAKIFEKYLIDYFEPANVFNW